MTEQQAQKTYKLIKLGLILLFAVFFIIIVTQTIIINTKSSQIQNLQSDLSTIQSSNNEINNQIESITNNYAEYAEEELRKNGYSKNNEQVFQ